MNLNLNWKKIASVSLAGAVSGGLVSLAHALLPNNLDAIAAPVVSGIVAAIVHKLDMWGAS